MRLLKGWEDIQGCHGFQTDLDRKGLQSDTSIGAGEELTEAGPRPISSRNSGNLA
jgi:hypothetical protein